MFQLKRTNRYNIKTCKDDYNNIMKTVIIDVGKKSDDELIKTIEYWLKNVEERTKYVDAAYEKI